jgi:predicted RNase H-like HicB family nuclease
MKNSIGYTMHFKVVLEEDEEVGGYVVSCPSLPGCFSQGDTMDEALENIKEAIQACLESLAEDELKTYLTTPSSRVVDVVA